MCNNNNNVTMCRAFWIVRTSLDITPSMTVSRAFPEATDYVVVVFKIIVLHSQMAEWKRNQDAASLAKQHE